MRLKANKTGNGELKLMKNYHPPRALVNSFLTGRSRALSGFNLNSKLELRALYNYCFLFSASGWFLILTRVDYERECVNFAKNKICRINCAQKVMSYFSLTLITLSLIWNLGNWFYNCLTTKTKPCATNSDTLVLWSLFSYFIFAVKSYLYLFYKILW